MKKTNPIGVRFDQDLLDDLKKKKIAQTPQQALNEYETVYKISQRIKEKPKVRDLNNEGKETNREINNPLKEESAIEKMIRENKEKNLKK